MTATLSAATGVFAVTATLVAALAWWSYARSRSPKLLVLAAGFSTFALAGITTAAWLFQGSDVVFALTLQSALLAVGITLVYLASVKR